MNIYFIVFFFILGTIVGSFLNSVVWRLKTGKKIIKDRSVCPKCGHKLAWYDLIPLISFLFLKGRCRYCHKPISWQYPLVELTTGIIFIFPFILPHFNITPLNYFYYLFLSSSLIIIFVFDLKYYLIPDVVLLWAGGIVILFSLLTDIHNLINLISRFEGAIIFSGFFLIQYLLSKGKWIGFGDVKLGALIGFVLGWKETLLCLFLTYLIGAIISLELIALKKKNLKSEIPFGPIIIMAFFLTLFWGKDIILWYIHLIT